MQRQVTILIFISSLLLGSCSLPFGWQLWAASGSITPTDSGFRPERDGFAFANYGAGDVTNLEPADLQRMFGDVVCTQTSPSCALTPTARIWMDEMNRAMANGHCEGMAVLSQYFYYGILQPQTFGADSAGSLQFANNVPLQREIAYWWATQATYPTRAFRVVSDPRSIIATLQNGLTQDADVAQLYTIGLYASDFTGGHTVTPIALRTIDAQTIAIQLYDNNTPEQTPEIIVHTDTNTWSYHGHAADGQAVEYHGDADSQTMDMTATAPRLEVQECPFCDQNPLVRSVNRLTTILFSATKSALKGNADGYAAYFVDAKGRRVGVIRGVVYNEIPRAQVTFLRGANDQWSTRGMPLIALPEDVEGTIKVTGAASVPVNITAFSAGSVLGIQDLALDDTLASDIRFDHVHGAVAVASAAAANPRVVLVTTKQKTSIEHTVTNLHVERGSKTAVSTAADGASVTVASDATQQVDVRTAVDDGQRAPREREEVVPVKKPETAPVLDDMAPAPVDKNQPPPANIPTETPPPTLTPRPGREPRPTRTTAPESEDHHEDATRTHRPGQRTPTPEAGGVDANITMKPTTSPASDDDPGTKESPTPAKEGDDDNPPPGKGDPPPTPTPTWGRWRPTESRERPDRTERPDHGDRTRSPEPTRRGEGTRAPEPTERPEATERPESTRAPEPTRSPEPTWRWDATHTPKPSRTPEPTRPPEPTRSPEPTRRWESTRPPEPTERPESTHRAEPTERPESTRRPEPTRRPTKAREHDH